MVKDHPIGVRFEPEERAALEKMASVDDRSISSLVRKLTVDALRAKGRLKKVEK